LAGTNTLAYFVATSAPNKAYCNRHQAAAKDLPAGKDETLVRIQRALLLLKTYLETFRRKYAYHFRRMSIDGQGVSTHSELVDMRSAGTIRVHVQAAGFQERVSGTDRAQRTAFEVGLYRKNFEDALASFLLTFKEGCNQMEENQL
jgi:hypothetical protein